MLPPSRKALTDPSTPKVTGSFDNTNSDLIVYEGDEIINPNTNVTYKITKFLGKGQFGQVFSVIDTTSKSQSPQTYALKISKSIFKYRQQAFYEIQVNSRVCIFICFF